jgi:acetyltransferase
MEFFYNPRSIAIVGASTDPRKPGGRPLAALQKRGYAGKLYPINPRYDEVAGLECYPTILDVRDDVDMAILSVPAESVLDVLEQCGAKGVKAVVVFSAGFAEVGPEGKALQQRMTDLARKKKMRLLGPNSLGLINLTNSVMASFAYILDLEPVSPKTLGFVTQSGAFGAMMFAEATEAGVGFSSFTSVGNEADTEFADFVGYLLGDPEAQVIGGYVEGTKDGDKLRRVAEQALALKKPILILKVGRTRSGARAASSHTGSLAGDDQIYDAFFKQMGIVRIEALSELVSFVILHRAGRIYRGRNVAILSGSGGHGVMLADKCDSLGLSVPEITGPTREKLEQYLPAFGSARNPVDLTAQGGRDSSMLPRCLRALVEDDGIDAVLAHAFFHDDDGLERAQELIDIYRSTTKPIVIMSHARFDSKVVEECLARVKGAGIPIIADGAQAAQAVANLVWYQEKVRRAEEIAPRRPIAVRSQEAGDLIRTPGELSEFECKRILTAYGIPVAREGLATSADEAVKLARELGHPVALKVQSAQILHKTEAGGVVLDLRSDDDVRSGYERILANARDLAPDAALQGVLVQEMLRDGVEVIVGTTKDPVFGPAVMFGLGGIFVEALGDVSFRIAPLARRDAEDMVREIRGYPVLEGMRGRPPVDFEALIDVILKVSRLVTDHRDEIEELDINPLVLFGEGAKAVDALVTKSAKPRNFRLAFPSSEK